MIYICCDEIFISALNEMSIYLISVSKNDGGKVDIPGSLIGRFEIINQE